jgi:hypothetical protein
MKRLLLPYAGAALLAAGAGDVQAESLRCNGHFTQVGDSRASVLYKCGEPLLRDAYCSPVYYGPGLHQVPPQVVGVVVPCQLVDEWLYDRGPGYMMVTVRFRGGVVQAIEYGRSPQ